MLEASKGMGRVFLIQVTPKPRWSDGVSWKQKLPPKGTFSERMKVEDSLHPESEAEGVLSWWACHARGWHWRWDVCAPRRLQTKAQEEGSGMVSSVMDFFQESWFKVTAVEWWWKLRLCVGKCSVFRGYNTVLRGGCADGCWLACDHLEINALQRIRGKKIRPTKKVHLLFSNQISIFPICNRKSSKPPGTFKPPPSWKLFRWPCCVEHHSPLG